MTDDVLASARALADHVAAEAPGWARARIWPRDAMVLAAEAGLTGLQVSCAIGGFGLPFSAKARVGRALARADFGFAMAVLNTHNVAHRIERDCAADIAERHVPDLLAGRRIGCTALTEPGAGSDFAAITTTAREDGDGWILNGEKTWIINAVAADLVVVYAQTEVGSGAEGIASFLVDASRAGFERARAIDMTAQHSIGAGGFRLCGYRAEAAEMIRPPGDAFRTALTDINGARVYVGAMCAGMVEACLEIATAYGRTRRTFGQPLVRHQGWRWALAEAEVDLAAADALIAEAGAIIDADGDARYEAARAKIFATRMAERHIPALAQLMGAEGLRDIYPFGRHQIGARVASFTDGSTEMLLERLTGRHMRGLD